MNIFISGDSFCANKKQGWPFFLEKMIPGSNITLYGEIGSSLFYTYQNLLSNIDKDFDYYIILITNPGRLYSEESPHFSNPFSAYNHMIQNEGSLLGDRCKATIDYYKYLRSDKFDNFVHNQLLEQITELLKHKNKIIFPCFKSSGVTAPFTMIDVLHKSFEPFNKLNYFNDVYKHYEESENVINHTSLTNQKILAEYFRDLIVCKKSNININSFKPFEESFNYYYKKI